MKRESPGGHTFWLSNLKNSWLESRRNGSSSFPKICRNFCGSTLDSTCLALKLAFGSEVPKMALALSSKLSARVSVFDEPGLPKEKRMLVFARGDKAGASK